MRFRFFCYFPLFRFFQRGESEIDCSFYILLDADGVQR